MLKIKPSPNQKQPEISDQDPQLPGKSDLGSDPKSAKKRSQLGSMSIKHFFNWS